MYENMPEKFVYDKTINERRKIKLNSRMKSVYITQPPPYIFSRFYFCRMKIKKENTKKSDVWLEVFILFFFYTFHRIFICFILFCLLLCLLKKCR